MLARELGRSVDPFVKRFDCVFRRFGVLIGRSGDLLQWPDFGNGKVLVVYLLD